MFCRPHPTVQGLLYGGDGNLTDGSSVVTENWGPKLQTGDVIDMKVEYHIVLAFGQIQVVATAGATLYDGGKTVISFRHNSVALGVAFNMLGWVGTTVRPIVAFSGPGVGSRGELSEQEGKLDGVAPWMTDPPHGNSVPL